MSPVGLRTQCQRLPWLKKHWVCVSVAAAVEVVIVLCDERGSCSPVPREEALCTDTLADRGGCVWSNWIYSAAALPHVASQHTSLQNKGIIENSSVHVRHFFSSRYCFYSSHFVHGSYSKNTPSSCIVSNRSSSEQPNTVFSHKKKLMIAIIYCMGGRRGQLGKCFP